MATTRIMPLHIGKGRTESRAISKIIDYVANPQKTDHGRLITGYECDSRVADAEFMLAKRQYIAATGRVRGADDVMYNAGRRGCMPLRPALFFLMSVPSRNMAVLPATSKNSCYLDSRICMYYTVLVTVIRLDWKRR